MAADKTATLTLNGATHELPILSPTCGPDVIRDCTLNDAVLTAVR